MTDTLPYKLCAIDLDETFLLPDKSISPRNLNAVRTLIAKGVTVVFASGRMHESIVKYGEICGVKTPIISYNGAMVQDPTTHNIWLHDPVTPADAVPILDYCEANSLHLQYYVDGKVLMPRLDDFGKLYLSRTDSPYEIVPNFRETVTPLSTTKLVIVSTPTETESLRPVFDHLLGDRLYITKTSEEYLEFMSPRVSKGKALAVVAERLGFTPANTLAFGNGQNDVPMLEFAAFGVAVANARPELLAIADRIAPDFTEDGVGKTLEEIYGF